MYKLLDLSRKYLFENLNVDGIIMDVEQVLRVWTGLNRFVVRFNGRLL
jgi:hypothetical protein